MNEIYNTSEILEYLSRAIFIVKQKKLGANKCKLHWIPSLMSHIIKVIRTLPIRAHRIRSKIRTRTVFVFFFCFQGTTTSHAIFMIRMLSK